MDKKLVFCPRIISREIETLRIFQSSSRKMTGNVEFAEMIGASSGLEKTKMEANSVPEPSPEPMFKDKSLKSKWN